MENQSSRTIAPRHGGGLSWLGRLTPDLLLQRAIERDDAERWMAWPLSRVSVAIGLRSDAARRARIVFRIGEMPTVWLGAHHFALDEVLSEPLEHWRPFVRGLRGSHPADVLLIEGVFDLLASPATRRRAATPAS